MFQFFANVWVTKLKTFSKKARQSLQDHLNSKLVIGSYLGNSFEVTLRSKTNVLSISKGKFLVFCNFWVMKLKPFFGKVRQNIKKQFKSKSGHRNLLRKWFWGYLELKNECSERLKGACFSFCKCLSDEKKLVKKIFSLTVVTVTKRMIEQVQ